MGCALSLIGSLIIVLHAPEDKEVETVDEILEYAMHPGTQVFRSCLTFQLLDMPFKGFLLYVLTITVYSVFAIAFLVPRWGRSNPLVYVSICSLVGSVSVMAIKGFGVAVKLTFGGKNQFSRPSAWFFAIVTAGCIVVQLNYFNKALDTFSVNMFVPSFLSFCTYLMRLNSVNPMYYVGFSTATIVASLILFQGFNTTDATNTVSLLAGFIVIFLGVHILNLSRREQDGATANGYDNGDGFLEAEGGLRGMRGNRVQGRLSVDGWHGIVEGAPPGSAHRRTFSGSGSAALFDAYDERRPISENVGLERLREESEEGTDSDNDSDIGDLDERTRLNKGGRNPSHLPRHGSRGNSQSRSPVPIQSLGDRV